MSDTPCTTAARRPLRCRLGFHRWINHSVWGDDWRCARCQRVPKPCSNCRGQHNPNAIVICTVTRTYR